MLIVFTIQRWSKRKKDMITYTEYSVEEYETAFFILGSDLKDVHYQIMRIQYHAPQHAVNYSEIAVALRYAPPFINLKYGELGRLIANVLQKMPSRRDNKTYRWWSVLSTGKNSSRGFLWTMHPTLVQALEKLEWITVDDHKVNNIAPQSTNITSKKPSPSTQKERTQFNNADYSWQDDIAQWIVRHRKIPRDLSNDFIRFFELAFENTSHPDMSWFGVHKQVVSLVIGGIFLAAVNIADPQQGIWLLLDQDFTSHIEFECHPVKSTRKSGSPLTWGYVKDLKDVSVLLQRPEVWQSYSRASNKILKSPISRSRDSEFQMRRQKKRVSDFWGMLRDTPELYLERQRIESDGYFNAKDIEDAKRRITSSIVQRQGQSDFRRKLLNAYDRRCSITGCDVEATLESAHIIPYSGATTNHPANGLLLRADIHTLFDLHLLSIKPDTHTVTIAPGLLGSSYQYLEGCKLKLPENKHVLPDHAALTRHYEQFLQKHGIDKH